MIASKFPARVAALPLALAAAFPLLSFAQAPAPGAVLPETVVTATRFLEPSQSVPIGVSVITAEEIRASGATTVNEALVRVLGIAGKQDLYGAADASLDLRGFGDTADSNQVVIVDGQRLNEADTSGFRLSGIPIDTVERIEVLRGSGAVLYGEGATAGVIVIKTRAGLGTNRRNSGSVRIGAGSDGLRDTRASATVAGGGFSVDVNGQKRKADNHRDYFRSDNDTADVTAQWSDERFRVGVRHAREDLDAQLPGGLTRAEFEANPRQSVVSERGTARLKGERSGVFAEAQLGSWQLAADAGTRRKTLRSSFPGFGFDFDSDLKAHNYNLRARHEGSFGAVKNIFVAGVDAADWDREVFGFFGSNASQRSRALYAKDDVILPTGTRISLGARTEKIRKDDSTTTTLLEGRQNAWELGLSQSVGGGVTVYGRAGRSYRLASVDEFNFTSSADGLRPQTSRDLELGARWSQAGSRLDARLYRSALTDEIGFDPAAPTPFLAFPGANVNFDPSRRQGLELDASHAVSKSVTARLNAAWRESTFRSGPYAGNDVPGVARRTVALRGDWTPAASHRVSGGVNWVSSQRVDFTNTCSIPSYVTADARYAYQWNQFELSAGVTNLFNRKFFSRAFDCDAGLATDVYPEPGRKFLVAARLQF